MQDYVAEVMAHLEQPTPDDITDGIPISFMHGIPLSFTTGNMDDQQVLEAIRLKISQHRFTQESLTNWSTTALYKSLSLLAIKQNTDTTAAKRVTAIGRLMISRQIRKRLCQMTVKEQRNRRSVIVSEYTGTDSERMQIQNILSDVRVAATFPRAARLAVGYPVLRWSYEKSIGSKLIQDKQVLQDFDFDDDSKDPECLCDTPEWAPFKCQDGHVCTTDLNCIKHQGYRMLCQKGVSFKTTPTDKDCLQLVETAISNYIQSTANALGVHPIEFEEWRLTIMTMTKAKMSTSTPLEFEPGCHVNWKQLKKVHQQYCKNWVMVQSDKSQNTFTWKCRAALVKQAREEMTSASTYRRCPPAARNELLKKHYAFAVSKSKIATTPLDEALLANTKTKRQPPSAFTAEHPQLGSLVKNHKNQANRWLARSAHSSMSLLSKWIHKALKACMVTSEQLWIDLMHYWHIHSEGSWVINKHDRVRQCMHKMNSNGIQPDKAGMSTHDFSSMYTTLKHEVLLQQLDEFVHLVFKTEQAKDPNRTILSLKSDGTHEWTDKKANTSINSKTTQHLDVNRLKEWIHYLIGNLFITTGGVLFKQITGIPMGTNAAPMIANLALFMSEFRYIKVIASNITHVGDRQWTLLRQLSYCNRFIDDLLNLCVEPSLFDGITKEIYSRIGLIITNETGDNPHRVDYLDMTIWYDKHNNSMVSKLFDKRVELAAKGLILNKFPHVDSCLSAQCKYGIVTSQCHRFMIACSLPKHFLRAAVDLREAFTAKNYKAAPLDKLFKRFLQQRRTQLRLKPDAVRTKHLHEKSTYKEPKATTTTATDATAARTPVATVTGLFQPILGKRKMGNTWYYLEQGLPGDPNTWHATPKATRQTNNQPEYLVLKPKRVPTWTAISKVPLLPCPGLFHQPATITPQGRQRMLIEQARAKQELENRKRARAATALVRAQWELGKAWKAPPTPVVQEDPIVRQLRIQEEYNLYQYNQRKGRNNTIDPWDFQKRQEAHMRSRAVEAKVVYVSQEQEDDEDFWFPGGY